MLRLTLTLLALAGSLSASEAAYLLWDGQESVAEYAKRANLPPAQTLELGGGVKMELVLIPAGKFIMGTPEPVPVDEDAFHKRIVTGQALLAGSVGALLVMHLVVVIRAIRQRQRLKLSLARLLAMTWVAGIAVLSGMHWNESARELEKAKAEYSAEKARYDDAGTDEKPAHAVALTKAYYMGKFTVTQEQYQQVAGANPSSFKGKDNPVETVSWDDAQEFCKKLTEQAKQTIRLPTEAEWEFACKAGTTTTYHSGDTESDLVRVAWYDANSKSTTHPVGQMEANTFGLFDMHGNVWQWCQDAKLPPENSPGASQGAYRSARGGSWFTDPWRCRSAARNVMFYPNNRDSYLGFRVVMALRSRTP